jgi:hypothetical protein
MWYVGESKPFYTETTLDGEYTITSGIYNIFNCLDTTVVASGEFTTCSGLNDEMFTPSESGTYLVEIKFNVDDGMHIDRQVINVSNSM